MRKRLDKIPKITRQIFSVGDHAYIEKFKEIEEIETLKLIEFDEKRERKLNPNINLIVEFQLINSKQSKLSKWERDKVLQRFNDQFERYDENN